MNTNSIIFSYILNTKSYFAGVYVKVIKKHGEKKEKQEFIARKFVVLDKKEDHIR